MLHATKNLTVTVCNLHAAMRLCGHLLFYETTAADPFVIGYAFGILPGWWYSEEPYRAYGLTITEAEWNMVLEENGFLGNDLVIRGYQDDVAYYASIICSTARASLPNEEVLRAIIIISDDSEDQKEMATLLTTELLAMGHAQPTVCSLAQLSDTETAVAHYTIMLADIGQSLLAEMTGNMFTVVQKLIRRSNNLLWVTCSNISENWTTTSYPHSALKDGLLRTLRQEFGSKRIVSLSIEDESNDISHRAQITSQIFHEILGETCPEVEYISRHGHILTGRISQAVELNRSVNSAITASLKTKPWLPGPFLKLDIRARGFLETLHFAEDYEHDQALGPKDVEIEAQAWSVNFRDVFGALGRIEEAEGFGSDCAGIVTRVRSECSHVRPGDHVCMSVVPCMRMFPRAEEWAVYKIPEHVTAGEACAVLNPAVTAWYSLVEVGRLRRGETVLIHSAAGATGQVALQVSQMLGAEVFATVGHKYKKDLLIDLYNLPEDHIFYSQDTSFADSVMCATDNSGVDIVLNSLVGEGLRASWECIAPYGRFIELGKADINANAGLPIAAFAKNIKFSAVDVAFHKKEREIGEKVLAKIIGLVANSNIQSPRPIHVYDVSAVEEAF